MTGGLMQLVAYGAQDIYLTGNPMITYFKVVYRRHTNFAMESIAQTFSGTVGYSNKVTALISRNGDLVNGMTLEVSLPALANATTRWTDDVGHHLIKQVEVEIGGQLIDRHYSDWLEVWAQLTVPASKMAGYREMIGQSPKDHLGRPNGLQALGVVAGATTINVPLQFWFCRNVGLALPLIALQYHEVKVNITFNTAASLVLGVTDDAAGTTAAGTAPTTLDATLWVDYIYLDTDERRRFAQVSHEYLIEQLQFTGDNAFSGKSLNVDLNFNHPVKELIWVARYADVESARQWSNYTDTAAAVSVNADSGIANAVAEDIVTPESTTNQNFTRPSRITDVYLTQLMASNPVLTAILKLNGHDRFAVRKGDYFNKVQTVNHHTNVPASPGINVYSFALKPEDHQPSGTCNFSRIDNAKLNLTLTSGFTSVRAADGDGTTRAAAEFIGNVKIFATNYNVLRIMSGMGGLAYSN